MIEAQTSSFKAKKLLKEDFFIGKILIDKEGTQIKMTIKEKITIVIMEGIWVVAIIFVLLVR